ncbi:MAG: GNAT family N-acetyltransferase [Nocardioides sp.]
MSRVLVTLREVTLGDAADLARLWGEAVRRGDASDPEADLQEIIRRVLANPDERIVIADCNGLVAGAVLLRVAPLTPLHIDPIVQVISPYVLPQFRRRGVGRSLMEAAAGYADERGIAHVGTASLSNSREANRFMARLGLSPHATLRVTSTHILRMKLSAHRADLRQPGRQVGQVLAARRSLRRSQSLAASSAD